MKQIKKLNKDQIQKIALSSLGFVGLIYCYFTFFLNPLERNRTLMTQSITDLQLKTASSKTEMKKTANLETLAKEATTRYEALKAMTPEGAPIAWFPPKMRNFFAAHEIDKANIRLESKTDFQQPELTDWVNNSWVVELPQSDFDALGRAVADLENTEPLLSVDKIDIHAVPDTPEFQVVNLRVQTALYRR